MYEKMWKIVLGLVFFAVWGLLVFTARNGEKRSEPQKDEEGVRLFFLAPTHPGPQNQKFLFTPN